MKMELLRITNDGVYFTLIGISLWAGFLVAMKIYWKLQFTKHRKLRSNYEVRKLKEKESE
jgi:hypothetical protein